MNALKVDTGLAQIIGLNESIVTVKISELLDSSKLCHDGRHWIQSSYNDWKENYFPFWSVETIKRIFKKLEKSGILISANYNDSPFDQTKWYSIATETLDSLYQKVGDAKCQ